MEKFKETIKDCLFLHFPKMITHFMITKRGINSTVIRVKVPNWRNFGRLFLFARLKK